MTTLVRVSEKGQITLPAALRRKLDLHPATQLEVLERGNEIVLRPIPPLSAACGALAEYAIAGATWEEQRAAAMALVVREALDE